MSRPTQIVVAVCALLAGLWIDPPRAVACSCAGPQGDAEAFAQADAVFVCDLMERRTDDRIWDTDLSVRLIFAVDTVYKGEVFERQSVVTAANGAACGLELTERGPGPYVVFARTTSGDGLVDDPVPGELTADLCSGSRPLADRAPPFDDGGPPRAGSSPIGGGGWWPPTRTNAIVGGFAVIAAIVLLVGFRRREPR